MVYATHSPLGPLADGILIIIILERIEIAETSEMASWSLRLTVRGGNPIGRDTRGKCPTTLERAKEILPSVHATLFEVLAFKREWVCIWAVAG